MYGWPVLLAGATHLQPLPWCAEQRLDQGRLQQWWRQRDRVGAEADKVGAGVCRTSAQCTQAAHSSKVAVTSQVSLPAALLQGG